MVFKGCLNRKWNLEYNYGLYYHDLVNILLFIYNDGDFEANIQWVDKFHFTIVYNTNVIYQSLAVQNISDLYAEWSFWDLEDVNKIANNKVICTYKFNWWNNLGKLIIESIFDRTDTWLKINKFYVYYDNINKFQANLDVVEFTEAQLYNLNFPYITKQNGNQLLYDIDCGMYLKYDNSNYNIQILSDTNNYDNAYSVRMGINTYSYTGDAPTNIYTSIDSTTYKNFTLETLQFGIKYYLFKNPLSEKNVYKDFEGLLNAPILAVPVFCNSRHSLTTRANYQRKLLLNDEYLLNAMVSSGFEYKVRLTFSDTLYESDWANLSSDNFIGIYEYLPPQFFNAYFWLGGQYGKNANITNMDLFVIPIGEGYKPNFDASWNLIKNNLWMNVISYVNPLTISNYQFFNNRIDYCGKLATCINSNYIYNENWLVTSTDALPFYQSQYYDYVNQTKNRANTGYYNAMGESAYDSAMGTIGAIGSIIAGALLMLVPGGQGAAIGSIVGGSVGLVGSLTKPIVDSAVNQSAARANYRDKRRSSGINSSLTTNLNNNISQRYLYFNNYLNKKIKDMVAKGQLTDNDFPLNIYTPFPGFLASNENSYNNDYALTILDTYDFSQVDKTYLEFNFSLINSVENYAHFKRIIINAGFKIFDEKDMNLVFNNMVSNLMHVRISYILQRKDKLSYNDNKQDENLSPQDTCNEAAITN